MQKTAAQYSYFAGAGLKRRLGTFVLLAALVMQNLLLSTHIHHKPLGYDLGAFASMGDDEPTTPSDGDRGACQICREISHAGQFVTPAASVLYAPAVSVSITAIVIAVLVAGPTPSFFWQGRAPPRT